MSAIERGVYAPPLRRDPGFGPIDPHVDAPRRGVMILFVSVAVLLALVGVIWSTYHQGVRERDEPALLAAPAEPYKVAPADPGGEQAEHQGIEVFNVLEDSAARLALLPPEDLIEESLPGVEAIEDWEVVEPHGTDVLAQHIAPEDVVEPAAAEPATVEEPPLGPPIAGGLTPEEMAAVPPDAAEGAEAAAIPRLKPLQRDPADAEDTDGPRTLATASDPSRRYFALREPMTRSNPAAQEVVDDVVEQGGAAEPATAGAPAPMGIAPPIETPPAASVTAVPAAAIAPSPARIAVPGSFLVQLASLRSAEAADVAWREFRSDFDDLIGGYAPDVERADLGDRGVRYRLRIGIFTDRTAASSFCDEVKARGRECLVVGG